MSLEEIKTEAPKLNPASRASLARDLLASLDSLSPAEVERLWIEEAIRRDDEVDQGAARLHPADEVLARRG
jgi:hypothetical protein